MNIPTKITTARIILVAALLVGLFVVTLIPDLDVPVYDGVNLVNLIACIVFIAAASTDFIDGHLARKWHQVTNLGKFLDPVADKMLVDSMLIFFIFRFDYEPTQTLLMPAFCVIVMVVRDLVVDAIRFIAAQKGQVVAANVFGKLKTVAQMVAIPVVMLNGWPFSYFDASWNPYLRIGSWLVYIATLFSLLSGIVYVVQNRGVLKEECPKGRPIDGK